MLRPNKITRSKQMYLPAHLFCGPWTNSKWALLRLLTRWGVSLNDAEAHLCYEAMKNAILGDAMKVVERLLIFRGEIDYELFRLGMDELPWLNDCFTKVSIVEC